MNDLLPIFLPEEWSKICSRLWRYYVGIIHFLTFLSQAEELHNDDESSWVAICGHCVAFWQSHLSWVGIITDIITEHMPLTRCLQMHQACPICQNNLWNSSVSHRTFLWAGKGTQSWDWLSGIASLWSVPHCLLLDFPGNKVDLQEMGGRTCLPNSIQQDMISLFWEWVSLGNSE